MKLLLVFAAVVVLCALVSAEKETKAKQHKKEERTAAKAHHGKSAKSRAAATAHAEKSKREHAPHGVKKSERKHDSKQKKANRSKGAKKAVRGRANREGSPKSRIHCPANSEYSCSNKCPKLTCANYKSTLIKWAKCTFENTNNEDTITTTTEDTNERRKGHAMRSRRTCICMVGFVRDEESNECVPYKNCGIIESTTEVSTTTEEDYEDGDEEEEGDNEEGDYEDTTTANPRKTTEEGVGEGDDGVFEGRRGKRNFDIKGL